MAATVIPKAESRNPCGFPAALRWPELIRDYDPFGEEGRRIIQIDVPDEPNGRLTGFTCPVDDFDKAAGRFERGEMTGLPNQRGYAASYAGMPLARFDALIKPPSPVE